MKKLIAITGGAVLVAGLGVVAPSVSTASVSTAASGDPATAAAQYISKHPELVRGSSGDAYKAVDTINAKSGQSHVRFHRTYKDLPVLGGDFVVHLSTADKVTGASVAQDDTAKVPTTPKVKKSAAAKDARQGFAGGEMIRASDPTLVVDARGDKSALAYRTVITGTQADGQTPSRQIVVTDATSGTVRSQTETIMTPIQMGQKTNQNSLKSSAKTAAAQGSGNGIFVGDVPIETTEASGGFSMLDGVHGDGNTCDMGNAQSGCDTFSDADNVWGNGTQADPASAGVDAHFGAATTFDYFKNEHNRNGIFDNGTGVPSRVHYGDNYVNAFWDGQQMTYGDGSGNQNPLVALDVAAHEMSHGVTENTAGLEYSGDAGGLNEATSDIFGTMVEFYANNANDKPDFLIGEEIDINGDGTPLRYMDDPAKDGRSYSCWSSAVPNSDPHNSSGVGNHFFYLLANGSGQSEYGNSPTCDDSTVAGIGNEKSAAIWFAALTQYMTSGETYADARADTVKAATDLYGAGSPEAQATEAAWAAVAVS